MTGRRGTSLLTDSKKCNFRLFDLRYLAIERPPAGGVSWFAGLFRLCLNSACARQYGVKHRRVRESDKNTPLHGVNWSASPVRFFANLCLVLSDLAFAQLLFRPALGRPRQLGKNMLGCLNTRLIGVVAVSQQYNADLFAGYQGHIRFVDRSWR